VANHEIKIPVTCITQVKLAETSTDDYDDRHNKSIPTTWANVV
jgi:hypothetical protein